MNFGIVLRDLPADASAYVRGPLATLEAARAAWHAASRKPERFRFATLGTVGTSEPPFDARIQRLGENIAVTASETSLGAPERDASQLYPTAGKASAISAR